jgi:hypothetical protein
MHRVLTNPALGERRAIPSRVSASLELVEPVTSRYRMTPFWELVRTAAILLRASASARFKISATSVDPRLVARSTAAERQLGCRQGQQTFARSEQTPRRCPDSPPPEKGGKMGAPIAGRRPPDGG